MTNPLLTFWQRLFGAEHARARVDGEDDDERDDDERDDDERDDDERDDDERDDDERDDDAEEAPARSRAVHVASKPKPRRRSQIASAAQASATIFLILRRMRAPLIALVTIFAISVVGLMLIPGQDPDGNYFRMGLLHSFYVISYTATTIGLGELPHPFTDTQRLWLIVSIYLSVIGWAYAIGSLFALLQDRDFRQALALQRFIHKVARLSEPFVLMVGHGQTGEKLGTSLDALGRRFIVIDRRESRIAVLERDYYHSDVPGLVGDPRNPGHLLAAGLEHPHCEAVLALTDDDEANLAVVMAAALLRPDLPVIARTISLDIAARMRAFGNPTIINPFDAFGNHLRNQLHAPASDQLIEWLTALPGERRPPRRPQVPRGRWVVCGFGRFGYEVTKDLRIEGLEVTIIDAGTTTSDDPSIIVSSGGEADWMQEADVAHAVGLIAATNSDIQNLSLIAAARAANPELVLVARRNDRANEPLFSAKRLDLVLVPPVVTAHEVLIHLRSPVLRRFLNVVPTRDNAWAAELSDRLLRTAGPGTLTIWQVRLARGDAALLLPWLDSGEARLGDLLRRPDDRSRQCDAVPLMVVRGDTDWPTPDDDFILEAGDELLLAGTPDARRSLDVTFVDEATREYVLYGRHVPSGWLWRRLARNRTKERASHAEPSEQR